MMRRKCWNRGSRKKRGEEMCVEREEVVVISGIEVVFIDEILEDREKEHAGVMRPRIMIAGIMKPER